MTDFIRAYRVHAQIQLGRIKREIDVKKEEFRATDWTDEKSMVEAANEIWRLEGRLKDALEIHKIIMDNTKDGD